MEDLNDENDIGESLEDEPTGGKKKPRAKSTKIDPVGVSFYGEKFKSFNRIGEITGLIPAFKEFYYAEKIKDPKITIPELMKIFNENVAYPDGLTFHPYPTQVRLWRTKWDRDIAEKRADQTTETALTPAREIRQVIKTRDQNRVVLGAPQDNELEAGVRTLAGELMNDAIQMLRDDQDLEELYDDETLIKRRNYIVNVFAHTTRMTQGKAALLLKASQEKRENASFLMDLMAKATAGKLSDEEMGMLKTTYAPKQNEPAQV